VHHDQKCELHINVAADTRRALRILFTAAGIAAIETPRLSRDVGEPEHSARSNWHVTNQSGKIAPWVIEHTGNGQLAEFFVVLADPADLSGAAALPTKSQKGRYVHDALWKKSQATQVPILQWLRDRGIEHRSFYIVNAILVKGSREIAEGIGCAPKCRAHRRQSTYSKCASSGDRDYRQLVTTAEAGGH